MREAGPGGCGSMRLSDIELQRMLRCVIGVLSEVLSRGRVRYQAGGACGFWFSVLVGAEAALVRRGGFLRRALWLGDRTLFGFFVC